MSDDPLIGRVLVERFEVERRIGEGGFSVIYEANQIGVDRKVAIKVLAANAASDPSWVDRFHRAARALARIDHPNAVRTLDSGTSPDGYEFIVMELLPGRTLRRVLEEQGALPPARAVRIVGQAARGLSALHDRGLIHRDLKPESLLCTGPEDDELVKMLFSIVLKTPEPDAPQTPAGRTLGTPWYLAPELALGARPTPSVDLYALGVILYELLAGRRPFDGESAVEVAVAHIKHAPPPLDPELPGLATAIALQALAKRPEERFATADALAETCETALRYLA